jgi:hypothetical protein
MTSFKTPTAEQIAVAVQRMHSPEHAAYFLARLNNPNWIGPLCNAGVFGSPPEAVVEVVEGEERRRFGPWPASQYLARMAKLAPEDVCRTFAEVTTNNPAVIGDMIDAALAMPSAIAARLVPKLNAAIQSDTAPWRFRDLSELCARLASEGQSAAALSLADSLFTLELQPGEEEPRGRDAHWYIEGLTAVIPSLLSINPLSFVRKVFIWLSAAIRAKRTSDPKSGDDHSVAWRPAIEEHPQNRTHDFAGQLVGCLRLACEKAISDAGVSLADMLELLDRNRFVVFNRMRLHLINLFANQNPELARRTMIDRLLFEDYRFKHELAMLFGSRFQMLAAAEKDVFFGWIDRGPDMSDFDEYFKASSGNDATDEDRRGRREYWQFERLHWIRNHLEAERKKFYDEMFARHGEPQLADLTFRTGPFRFGHESPICVAELEKLSFDAVLQLIAAWRPDKRSFLGPDLEGLAAEFGKYVAAHAEEFAASAESMQECPPIFVRQFIERMTDATASGKQIDLQPILNLCRWIVEQPCDSGNEHGAPSGLLEDTNWQWTRESIARLVQTICAATAASDSRPQYPLDPFRTQLSALLKELVRDPPHSSISYSPAEIDPRTRDFVDLGINSARGKALQALFAYVRWIGNHDGALGDHVQSFPGGFEVIPEVREMLEWQLAQENRSVEALAVIGLHIGLLHWLDKGWLQANASRLFDLEQIEQDPGNASGWAAWNAFVSWTNPHIEFYKMFRREFRYAVGQAPNVVGEDGRHERPMDALGEHLLILYARGQLTLDDDEQLLRRFLTTAAPDIRSHAMTFVGRSLEVDVNAPEEVICRYADLWDWYWPEIGHQNAPTGRTHELFGNWFVCERFPDKWSLERLRDFVEVVPSPEPDDRIIARLERIASVDIGCSVTILDRMVRGDTEGWHVHAWHSHAEAILALALRAEPLIREQAIRLIDYLGRRGYTDFGALL